MRKFGLLFIIAISLLGCKSNKNESSIKGEIKGLTNDTIYLFSADGITDRMDTIYTENGKFSHTLHIDTITPAIILLNDSIEYPVFIDKGNKIEVKGSATGFLDITGNPANEELAAFRKEISGLGKPSEKALQEKAEAFIRQHHSSLASTYLLDKYFIRKEQPDYGKIKDLIDLLTGALLDQPSIEKVSEYITRWESVIDGKPAPYFNLPNAKGEKVSRMSEKLKNKYLLINFWATYDTDSIAQSQLKALNRKYGKNKDFALLGISIDFDKKTWTDCIKKDTLSWEQVRDSTGWESEAIKRYAILSLPANVLVSPQGVIIARDIEGDSLSNKIKEVLKAAEIKKKEEKKTKH